MKTDGEITDFIECWLERNLNYKVGGANSHAFAEKFCEFLDVSIDEVRVSFQLCNL